MKNEKILTVLLILVAIYFFLRSNHTTEKYIIKSTIDTIRVTDTIKIVSKKTEPRIATAEEKQELSQTIKDTINIAALKVASIDTCFTVQKKFSIQDTTLNIQDTVFLSIKYFMPPISRFYIKSKINSSSIYYKQSIAEIPQRTGLLDRIHLGIGIGYSVAFNNFVAYPSINIGLYYKLK